MRTVYLGTSEFAVAVLRRLADSPHRPVLVVTPPDRPRGRGRRLAPPPVAAAAGELGMELHQAERVSEPEPVERIRAAGPEVGVVCAFGQLIREPLLSELEMLNVHPSLIPRWRGAAPIERAIMAGDAETGVTIMRVDGGARLRARSRSPRRSPIEPSDDYGTLSARLAELGGELIVRALDLAPPGGWSSPSRTSRAATYAEKIVPGERRLDPARPAVELERTVRALNPHIGAYLELDGGRAARRPGGRGRGRVAAAGRLAAEGGALRLGCGEGVLRLEVVQPPGKRPMAAEAYLRGHPPPQGGGVTPAAATIESPWTHRSKEGGPTLQRPGCPGCGEPWLRPTQLPGRYRCVYCLRRYELVSRCPNCGAHQTIVRMSTSEDMLCQHCGGSMLQVGLMEARPTRAAAPRAGSCSRAGGSRRRSSRPTSPGSAPRSPR